MYSNLIKLILNYFNGDKIVRLATTKSKINYYKVNYASKYIREGSILSIQLDQDKFWNEL